MSKARRRLTPLCIGLLAVLSMMAIGPGAAHAVVEWRIGGKYVFELEGKKATVETEEATLALSIPSYETTILCYAGTPSRTLLPNGTTKLSLEVSYCELDGPTSVTEKCEILEPFTLTIKGSLIRHEGQTFLSVAAAEAGKPLGTISFKKGTECPVPAENPIQGTAVGEITNTEAVYQLAWFEPKIEKLFPKDTLEFGSKPAALIGYMELRLGGGQAGKKWKTEFRPEFKVEGKTFSEAGIEEKAVQFTSESAIFVPIPEYGLEISCTDGVGVGKALRAGYMSLTVEYLGCAPPEWTLCTLFPTESDALAGKNQGKVKVSWLGTLVKHGSPAASYLEIEGEKGSFFSFYLWGEFCIFQKGQGISGSTAFLIPGGSTELSNQAFEFVNAKTRELLGVQLWSGMEKSQIYNGNALMKLTSGEKWGTE
jgi:hypothetical protein